MFYGRGHGGRPGKDHVDPGHPGRGGRHGHRGGPGTRVGRSLTLRAHAERGEVHACRAARDQRPGGGVHLHAVDPERTAATLVRMSSSARCASARCTFASLISTGPGVVKRVAVSWVNLVVGLIPPLKVPVVGAGRLPVVGAGAPAAPVQAAYPRTRTAAAIRAAGVRGPRPLITAHLVVIPQRPWDVSALAEGSSPVRALSMSMIESATYCDLGVTVAARTRDAKLERLTTKAVCAAWSATAVCEPACPRRGGRDRLRRGSPAIAGARPGLRRRALGHCLVEEREAFYGGRELALPVR